MKNNFLDQFYTIDPDSGDYIIDVALKDYDEVFNTWDSSVYNIRDLDSSLKSFLDEFSFEIESRHNIKLIFNMQNEKKDTEMETRIRNGVRNHFNYQYFLTSKHKNRNRNKSFIYIVVSVLFTILSTYLQNTESLNLFQQVLLLNLTVGSWVFLWEAFSILFMQRSDMRRKRKHYERIVNAPIEFRYH
ncbi:MAG: hypothetical protein L0J41_07935 [Alkalibacterium sp.]|uniref:Uncharacterized protein n=1 Tax=Alkalibacterium gilvum TaxID=1130080 RepID=A0A1H6SFK8_9LACT|nr:MULTISPECIES: hypothetical protein [Alkalibacterium]MDN6294441.1 hypothetical protein [Alkalibacterium sp.]MDN6296288.1 hypothetical protein [Alkalibacterium sp.]SEI62222.1 hypothetical protein SAMN04488113_1062 [Alkalibacterium gilvum]